MLPGPVVDCYLWETWDERCTGDVFESYNLHVVCACGKVCHHKLPTPSSCYCVCTSEWLVVVRYTTSVFSGLTSSGAHTPISIDSHPTLEDINKFIVCEVPSSATISSAPTTDDKQLSSVTISEIHPDKPLVPIHKEGGATTPHHDDPTPPTSAGETECLPQCTSECILYLHLLTSV